MTMFDYNETKELFLKQTPEQYMATFQSNYVFIQSKKIIVIKRLYKCYIKRY